MQQVTIYTSYMSKYFDTHLNIRANYERQHRSENVKPQRIYSYSWKTAFFVTPVYFKHCI